MASRILPADSELVRMRDSGMTHAQIAEEISRRNGRKVARSTISVALHRAGEQREHRVRYKDEVPWRVPTEYNTEYPVRMLRALGRRNAGLAMTDEDNERLDIWLAELKERKVVVAYCPNPPRGHDAFYYIPESAKDHDEDIPIRKEPVNPSQIGF